MIDWTDPTCPVTEHFTVGDALTLHKWERLANGDDGIDGPMLAAIVATLKVMEQVREILGCPINVHCTYRSPAYNLIPGVNAPMHDAHSQGLAMDFDCSPGMTTDDVKAALMSHIEDLGLRMEDNGAGASWIHLDRRPVGNARFFKP